MEKAQIDALLAAHGGRPQPVASLHLLRIPSISPAAHAFLKQHAAALATIDLSRWLDRASHEQRRDVLEALIDLADREPSRFEFEIARAPHFPFQGDDRREMVIRLVGRVPESVIAALSVEPPPRRLSSRPGDVRQSLPRAPSVRPRAPSVPPGMSAPPSSDLLDPSALGGDSFFDPSDILSEMGEGDWASDLLSDEARTRPEPGLSSDDFLGLGDLDDSADPLQNKPSGAHSTSPELDALLTELEAAKSPRATSGNRSRARTAWKKKALAAAQGSSEDWAPSALRLPAAMRDAVSLRAAVSPREGERAALLEWLLQNGAKRGALVDLTVALLSHEKGEIGAREWLAQSFLPRLLPDKAAWSRHGTTLLTALIEKRAFTELDSFLAAAGAGASALGPGLVSMPGAPQLTPSIAAALSASLIATTSTALANKDTKRALACAAALACMGIASKDRASIATLARKKASKGQIATVLSLAESRARKPKDTPRVDDLVATVHVLSDAMS